MQQGNGPWRTARLATRGCLALCVKLGRRSWCGAATVPTPTPLSRAAPSGHNQPRHHARDTRTEVKASLGPRGAAHLRFASCLSINRTLRPALHREKGRFRASDLLRRRRRAWGTAHRIATRARSGTHRAQSPGCRPRDRTAAAGEVRLPRSLLKATFWLQQARTVQRFVPNRRTIERPSAQQKNPAFAGLFESGRPDLNRGPHRPELWAKPGLQVEKPCKSD
jgi:hypothetical protein